MYIIRGVILVLSMSILSSLKAQDPEVYNEVYMKTYLETSQTDFKKSLEVADSLLQISETPLFKTRSLMLSASIYQNAGDLKKAVEYALKAEKQIENTNDFVWKARVNGFLATQYRFLKLNKLSKNYIEKSFENAQKIAVPDLANSTLGLLLQERAYIDIQERNYKEAITHLDKSLVYFQKITQNRDYLVADIQQMLGSCYLKLEKYQTALEYYQAALESYGDLPDNYMKGLIYKGLGDVYLEMGELDKSYENLKLALEVAQIVEHAEYQISVYESFIKYYTLTKDFESLPPFYFKRDSINDVLSKTKMNYVDESFSTLDKESKQKISTRNLFILLLSVIAFSLAILFVIYQWRQKKNIENYKRVISKLKQPKSDQPVLESQTEISNGSVVNSLESENSTEQQTNSVEVLTIMPNETEERILKKLEEFEASDKFTKNSISLSAVAVYCKTNVKYLSKVINTHKDNDFNSYINELRINYIINKLHSDPVYLKYKIATLAEFAGFSSQNQFSTVFKKVTLISPSVFIKLLQKEKEKAEVE